MFKNLINEISALNKKNPQLVAAFSQIVKLAIEAKNIEEQEQTKRVNINKERDCVIKKFDTQKEIILKYLEKTFDERGKNFEKMFSNLDKAIDKKDSQLVNTLLGSILNLAVMSPFKDLGNINKVQENLKDKSHEWEI